MRLLRTPRGPPWGPGPLTDGYARGDGLVRLASVGGADGRKEGGTVAGGANEEGLPEGEPIRPFWVKKRFRESHSDVKRAGSRAQSQSSACLMLSRRSG